MFLIINSLDSNLFIMIIALLLTFIKDLGLKNKLISLYLLPLYFRLNDERGIIIKYLKNSLIF
jgi:hypothetical protein